MSKVIIVLHGNFNSGLEHFVCLGQYLVTGNELPGDYLSRPRVTGKPFAAVYVSLLFFYRFV